MLIAAFDVQYLADGRASAAAVLFHDYKDPRPAQMITQSIPDAADYIPGQFCKRELPCILKLIERIGPPIDEIVIDGYVSLDTRPGLGQHLFESLGCRVPIIGVAKSKFAGSSGTEVLRGRSRRPLFITSAGTDQRAASERIRTMRGPYRIPTLLKLADRVARAYARKIELGAGNHIRNM
jgi:deoxyribonuclease V